MKSFLLYISTATILIAASSCNNQDTTTTAQPITLGDSSMIVTETDSQYLKNVVDDIEPVAQTNKPTAPPKIDTPVAAPPAPVAKTVDTTPAPTTAPASVTNNSKNDFVLNIKNNTQIVFKNIATREFKNQNPETQHDLSYLIINGSFEKSQLEIQNGTLTDLQYKVATTYYIKTSQGEIELTGLKGETSDWQKLPTKGNTASLPSATLKNNKTIPTAQLQAAIEKAINNKRYKASVKDQLRKELAGVKSINHNLISLKATHQQLTIAGKDSKGANFKKIIRFDL